MIVKPCNFYNYLHKLLSVM